MERPMFKAQTFYGYPLKKTSRQKHWEVGKIVESEQVTAEIDYNPSAGKIAFYGLIVNNIDPFRKKEKNNGVLGSFVYLPTCSKS